MNHSPADIVRQALIDLDGGESSTATNPPAWSVYAVTEPDNPDNAITVQDTEGRLDGANQISGDMHEHQGIQIRIRSTDHRTGYLRAGLIQGLIDRNVHNLTVTVQSSTYLIVSITRTSPTMILGKEGKSNRHLFTINAVVALYQVS